MTDCLKKVRKMKKILIIFSILIFAPILAAIGIYLFMAWQYQSTFSNGVMINGIYATGMTPDEVNGMLVEKTSEPVFSIEDKSGNVIDIPIADMDFSYTYMNDLNRILSHQNSMMWGIDLVYGNTKTEDLEPVGECNLDKLEEYVRDLKLIKNQADPKKLRVEIIRTQKGYKLIDETQDLLDVDKVVASVKEAVQNGEEKLNLEDAGCYISIDYTPKMKQTLDLWKKIDELQSVKITCNFYDGKEEADAGVIASWILKDENGELAMDEDGNLMIDEDAVGVTVEKWAKRHDSVGGPWTFHPTRGGTVTIKEGTYGYKLNQKEEKAYLLKKITARKNDSSEAIYSQKGWGKGVSDIGDTYIEVDMTEQMLYYYVRGRIKIQAPIVTGNVNRGNGTPERVCYIYFKQRNRVLVGPDYRSPVKYWMAVYNHIGIHDASWRGKFGGEIYKTNGSHGCINTPTKEVSELYELAEVGTPVVLFY